MHHPYRAAVNRLVQWVGLAVVSAALIAPGAHAGERKKAPVKKQQASASVAKRAVAPRKVAASNSKAVRVTAKTSKAATRVAYVPAKPSFGQLAGLHEVNDPLDLKSSVALVIDQDTHEVLLSKNDHAVLPIASLTKLMTGMIISQAKLPMDEPITITQDDVDTEKGSSSRLVVGTTLTRGEMLHLALMSSENRAAHALGRTFPGGLDAFVAHMNAKARLLGMTDTRYVEPTGLSSRNQSSARDLATLVNVAHVSAGQPIGPDIGLERQLRLDRGLFARRPDYLLQVQGDSMIDDGILDGDLVGVHRSGEARNGQIVVARLDDEITIKRLERGGNGIRLLPRNPAHAPIVVAADADFAIEGIYCGLIRQG